MVILSYLYLRASVEILSNPANSQQTSLVCVFLKLVLADSIRVTRHQNRASLCSSFKIHTSIYCAQTE